MSQPLLEICVDSVESALAAQAGGADRTELCQALGAGGLTPSAGLLKVVRRLNSRALVVMIRPRGGDFLYSPEEFEIMKHDITLAKGLGADGIVTGLLNPDGSIDLRRTTELVELADPLPVTFHRAFDVTSDPAAALESLVQAGVARVLTSGQENSAADGLDLIKELVVLARDRISVMAGGGITEANVRRVVRESGVREFHVSASVARESEMRFRNDRVTMGGPVGRSEYQLRVAGVERIRRFRALTASLEP